MIRKCGLECGLKILATAVLTMGLFTFAQGEKSDAMERGLPAYLVTRIDSAELRSLQEAGQIKEAEAWIDAALATETDAALVDERERLRRLRRDYSVTAVDLQEKISRSIPDVTLEEIEGWRAEGHIQWAVIDGELRFFRREPVNLFRFSEEARARRDAAREEKDNAPAADPAARPSRGVTLEQIFAEALETAKIEGPGAVNPVRFRVRHTVTVDPDAVPEGETIRCWLPYPKDYRQQKGGYDLSSSPEEHYVAPNDAPQRTVYMEQSARAGEPTVFQIEYSYENASFVTDVDPEAVLNSTTAPKAEYLEAHEPHLTITDEMRTLAAEIVGDETNPWKKAHAIFHWMDQNIRYTSEMEYSILTSVSEKIMAERHGDCGVQAILFIGLCRAAGVPARWQSGWVTRPGYWNMHDWAEFYVEPYGWLAADPSVGLRKSADDPAVRNFLFGNIDAYRMIANLDFDVPFDPPKTHMRSDTVDNQRGELEWDGGNLYYDDWSHKVEILEAEPIEQAEGEKVSMK